MRERLRDGVIITLMLSVSIISMILACNCMKSTDNTPPQEIVIDTIPKQPKFFSQGPKEGLKEALKYYDVKHSDIVHAQAILETGHFKSRACIENNNLFGLYDSKNKRYYKFNHWSESVIAYKEMVQYKYESSGNYYKFLNDINYAEDKNYINKLKKIVKDDKRRFEERDTFT